MEKVDKKEEGKGGNEEGTEAVEICFGKGRRERKKRKLEKKERIEFGR